MYFKQSYTQECVQMYFNQTYTQECVQMFFFQGDLYTQMRTHVF